MGAGPIVLFPDSNHYFIVFIFSQIISVTVEEQKEGLSLLVAALSGIA